jgi:glycosyltransferase involved in cell wall biosynthesis
MVSSSINLGMKYSDFILFPSSTSQKKSLEIFRGLRNWETIISMGTKDSFRRVRLPARRKGGEFVIGFVGALAFRKNIPFMLETAFLLKNYNKYKFLIYGSGAEAANLLEFKNRNGLDNVHFMGFAPEKDLLKIYDSFDVFFYPSTEEGSSFPILNAQTRGLPVIVYTGNHMDLESTRYCTPCSTPLEASRIIKRLEQKGYNPKERKISTEYARSFTWDRVADETLNCYRRLLKKKVG